MKRKPIDNVNELLRPHRRLRDEIDTQHNFSMPLSNMPEDFILWGIMIHKVSEAFMALEEYTKEMKEKYGNM